MKKLFTLAIAAGIACSASLGAKSLYRLTEFGDYDSLEIFQFEWNDDNQIVRQNVESDDETYRLYVYNEQGLLALEEGYQYLYDEADPKKEPVPMCTYRVKYFYDEEGRQVEKWVVNDPLGFTGIDFNDAVYVNEFNANGQLAVSNQYFVRDREHPERWADVDKEKVKLNQAIKYKYNDMAQLIEEEYDTYEMNSDKIGDITVYTYIYDGKGRNVVIKGMTNNLSSGNQVYIYDEEGACQEFYATNSQFRFEITDEGNMEVMNTGNINRRMIFTCSDVPAEDCLYPAPIYNEEYGRIFNHLTNQLESIDEYRQADDEQLHQWGSWEFSWDKIEVNGIEGIAADDAQVDFTVNGNVMTINGLDHNASVKIFDMNGRLVQASKGGMVYLGHLNQGAYVVATPAGNAKIVR